MTGRSGRSKGGTTPYRLSQIVKFQHHARDHDVRTPRPCVYCDGTDHHSIDCKKVEQNVDRKRLLSSKQLCFNCARPNHKAVECKSRTACQKCKRHHHTSNCELDCDGKSGDKSRVLLTASSARNVMVTYPVVIVEVTVDCRSLFTARFPSSLGSCQLHLQIWK